MHNLDLDSATLRDIDPEVSIWAKTVKTNIILADIYDILSRINANLVAVGERKPAKKVKPYPRPGKQDDPENVQHFGSGALPVKELHEWIEQKRKEHARSSTGNNHRYTGA